MRLISYLTIDMGWSNELTDPSVYEDENLVDTFQPDKVFELNYFGFCKRSNRSKIYCTSNQNYGMDVLEVLVRDVGIQLGNISTTRSNETKKFGDSLVLTYRLALTSIRDFLKHDKHSGNALSKALIGTPDPNVKDQSPTKNYSKGVNLAYILMVFNGMVFYLAVLELIVGFLSICVVSAFGGALSVGKRHRLFPILLKFSSSILVTLSTLTLLCNVIYLIALKTLEPDDVSVAGPDRAVSHTTGWELLQVNVGKRVHRGACQIRYSMGTTATWHFLRQTITKPSPRSLISAQKTSLSPLLPIPWRNDPTTDPSYYTKFIKCIQVYTLF